MEANQDPIAALADEAARLERFRDSEIKWNKVMEALSRLYERYSKVKVIRMERDYDLALDELMRAYDEWLD